MTVKTGRLRLEDTSIASDLVPEVRDDKGNVLIYDMAPAPQKPEPQEAGIITDIKLVRESILAGIGR